LVDTGIFDQSRYFDVVVEYAKLNVEDLIVRISVSNRGPEAALGRSLIVIRLNIQLSQ